MVAPTSRTIDCPRKVGQIAASAGRSICCIVRRQNFAMAISAPVLPADTATSASPFFTASSAIHMDDVRRPWRSAWLGLSPICTETDEWTTRETPASAGYFFNSAETACSSPKRTNEASGRRSSASAAPGTLTVTP